MVLARKAQRCDPGCKSEELEHLAGEVQSVGGLLRLVVGIETVETDGPGQKGGEGWRRWISFDSFSANTWLKDRERSGLTANAQWGFKMLPVLPVAVGVAGENDVQQRDQELAGPCVPEEFGTGDEGHGED